MVALAFEVAFPAAFGRLCVETSLPSGVLFGSGQPPSGGCVLKHLANERGLLSLVQPPSGGCVLKPLRRGVSDSAFIQPPSGGCVLKHF